jgi:hypothetical protein
MDLHREIYNDRVFLQIKESRSGILTPEGGVSFIGIASVAWMDPD